MKQAVTINQIRKSSENKNPPSRYIFNRMEFAGSLGDLGTLLPMSIGMILINGLSPMGTLLSIGIFFILSGIYYGVTAPVQPMKVIGAYAIATAMSGQQIMASAALMAICLLIVGASNIISHIGKFVPKSVIRGVQLSTGTLLMAQGVKFMTGASAFQILRQTAEPWLRFQTVGPLAIGIPIGIICGLLTLYLLDSKKYPAGLVVVIVGLCIGIFLGTHEGLADIRPGIYLPEILPFGLPGKADLTFALFALVLPQLPMTIGNAVIANGDLSKEYFGEQSAKVSYRALTISMGLANVMNFFLGGMPLCHGAGGLAAHYRFGARTAGSNLMIGGIFVFLSVFLGPHAMSLIYLMPMSVLGVLLLFAGSQLALTIMDMKEKKDFFVTIMILGITLASNLAIGFTTGIVLAHALRSDRLKI